MEALGQYLLPLLMLVAGVVLALTVSAVVGGILVSAGALLYLFGGALDARPERRRSP